MDWPWLAIVGTGGPSHGRPRVTQVEHGWALLHLSFLSLQKSQDVCGCRWRCAGGSFERLSAEWLKRGLALNSTGALRFMVIDWVGQSADAGDFQVSLPRNCLSSLVGEECQIFSIPHVLWLGGKGPEGEGQRATKQHGNASDHPRGNSSWHRRTLELTNIC